MAAAAAATDVRDMQPFVSTYCASTVSAHVIITHSGRLLASNRDTQVAAAAVVVVAAAAKRGGGGEGACASLSLSHPCDVPRAYSLGISVRSRSSARPSVRPSVRPSIPCVVLTHSELNDPSFCIVFPSGGGGGGAVEKESTAPAEVVVNI